jgi:hypothetical protein
MMAETIFALGNVVVLPFWGLMILAPGWAGTRRVTASPWIAAPPAVLYLVMFAALLFGQAGPPLDLAAFGSAAGVGALLSSPEGAAIGWMHFLAFDLFVGRWAYLDGRARGLSPWLMGPVLFATLMAGPLGLLLYLLARGRAPSAPPAGTPAPPR